ncbi:MAG TPA: GAF domain-containing sensor histidine kinase [Aquabacterium sp.]|uniref:GAF domain-containing sensor histidine kinase n=1 Tax=Aquabacterium sp. TaxID=1872578 RepID=UPI002E2F5C27|nr:GAF domain-containing sensor histidine kinase [Aquabacterium sp.]HEX5355247.1 GAF domain-containing sensor histidine kinase [Aquabacterium sp.]
MPSRLLLPLVVLRRTIRRRALATQIGAAGALVSGGVAALVWWQGPAPIPTWLAMGLTGGLSALGAAAVAHHAMKAQRRIVQAAQTLRSPEAPDTLDIPLTADSADAFQLSSSLRRMVMAMRKRRKELEALNEALTHRLQTRTHELSTLQDLSIGLARQTDMHQLVNEALQALERTLSYSSASLWAREQLAEQGRVVLMGYRTGDPGDSAPQDELTGMRLSRSNLGHYERIERERQPLIENDVQHSFWSWLLDRVTDDARTSALYRHSRSWMALPLQFRDCVLGVMRVDHEVPGYFDDERIRLLTAVGSQTALAMRHAQLAEQSRDMAVMAERNRIARDLHDAVSQTLFAANVVAGTLTRSLQAMADPDAQAQAAQARSLQRLTQGALAEMRLLMLELRPDALHGMSLGELLKQALDALVGRSDILVTTRIAPTDGLSEATRMQLYRIAQEALSNVARHSGASELAVRWVVRGPDRALLCIHDNGAGFDPAVPKPGHFGLENMQTRARDIGAALTLESAPGQGTELCVQIGEPFDAD